MTESSGSPPQAGVPEQAAAENPARAGVPDNRADGESSLRAVVSVVTTLGPPLTIATALMIYFGWARSATQAEEMGLDVSLFGYSTQDYVLQSISTLYIPLLCIATLALAGLGLHRRVDAALRRPPAQSVLRGAGRSAFFAGLVLIVLALGIASATRGALLAPLTIAFGTVVAAYGAWLRTAAGTGSGGTSAPPASHRALRMLLVGGVVTSALFWAVSDFATIVGRGYAQQVEANVEDMPRVTVFSGASLGIEAPGVLEEPMTRAPANGTAFRYRTSGLRFLVSSGGRMFLLHDGWTVGDGTVVVLPDNDQLRWQFSR
jgi:hypothetical protein